MGRLSPEWRSIFEGMDVIYQADGNTLLTGILLDQADLYGLLLQLRDLGLTLISVTPAGRDKRNPAQ